MLKYPAENWPNGSGEDFKINISLVVLNFVNVFLQFFFIIYPWKKVWPI